MKEYDSLSDNEKCNMLASVANLYYNAEMTQNQIAERFPPPILYPKHFLLYRIAIYQSSIQSVNYHSQISCSCSYFSTLYNAISSISLFADKI